MKCSWCNNDFPSSGLLGTTPFCEDCYKIITKGKNYPFFKPTDVCKHCNQPIMVDTHASLYLHNWERWNGDNGFYCDPKRPEHAEPK